MAKGKSKKLAVVVVAGVVALTLVAGSAYAAVSGLTFTGSQTLAKITTQLTGLGAKVDTYEANESILLGKINDVRATANERIGAANTLISQIKSVLATSEADKAALENLNLQMQENIRILTEQKQALQSEYDSKVSELEASNGENADLRAQVVALGEQIKQTNDRITALNSEIATKNAAINELNDQIVALNGQITNLNDAIAALNAQITELQGRNATLSSENASLQSSLDKLNRDFALLHQNVIAITNALAASGQENAAKQSEIDRLNSELAAANTKVEAVGTVSETVEAQTVTDEPLTGDELNSISTSVDPVADPATDTVVEPVVVQ